MSTGVDIPTSGDVVVVGFDQRGVLADTSRHFPHLLQDLTQRLWDDLRRELPQRLRSELGRGDLIADGFTLYDIVVHVSAECRMTVQRTLHGDLAVHVVTGRNTLIATTTTPTVFGSWGDPRFSLDFGLAFGYEVDVPPVAAPFGAARFTDVRLTMPHADSQNFAADLLLVPVRIAELFGSWSLDGTLARLLGAIDLTGVANAHLGSLNVLVGDLASKGFPYLELLAGDPAALERQLGARGAAVRRLLGDLPADTSSLLIACRKPDTSGVVEGEIAWRESEGRPVDAKELAMLRAMAEPVLGRSGLDLVRARVEGASEPTLLAEEVDAVLGGRTVIRDAADRYATVPTATTMQLSSLASPTAARVWDSRRDPPPAAEPGDGRQLTAVSRSSFESLLGGPAAYLAVLDVFRRGPKQFEVTCIVPDAGGGHRTGRMVGMWHDDSEGWRRRRYRLEDVETDQPLDVGCALADGYTWRGPPLRTIARRNWSGRVTVGPPRDFASQVRDGDLQVTVNLTDGSRRTVPIGTLEALGAVPRPAGGERSIIVVGGIPAEEVALNPQPLPPRVLERLRERLGEDAGIIVVGGRPGEEASLNPQPLPPRWREELLGGLGGGHTGVVIRGRQDEDGSLRVGRTRVEEAVTGLEAVGGLGGLGRLLQRTRGQERVRRGPDRRGGQAVSEVRAGPVEVDRAVQTAVDSFGDLVATAVDPDVLIPDVADPRGHGTVRGVDFRVWVVT